MKPFTSITAPALIIEEDSVDTDVIYPARFLLIMQRDGLGKYFCFDRRHDGDGNPLPNPIDDAKEAGAGILIAGRDFGCGSSREQAVWTIADFGISCVIAESLGEIFRANCVRNGVLPIVLTPENLDRVRAMAAAGPIGVELAERRITGTDGDAFAFEIPEGARERLLNGWDETGLIQNRWSNAIDAFEANQRQNQPWLYEELVL